MIVSYIRTSVWKKNKVTMEMQQEAIHAKLDELGLPRPESHHIFEDRGISGAKFEGRPGLQRMLEELKKDSAVHSTLVVYRFDRLSRDTGIMIKILDVLEKNDIELISVMEPLPENNSAALQKMVIYIHGTIAQFQRDMLIENVKMGLEQKRKEARPLSYNVPFGYSYTNDRLEAIEPELAVVRKIYDLYLTGRFGYKKICNQLNQAGMTFKGRQFLETDIYRILSNKTYFGILKGGNVGGEYEGSHVKVVTKAEYQKVQTIRSGRHATKKSTRTYWLRRKIVCPKCGKILTPRRVTNNKRYYYYYYYCAKPSCEERGVNASLIEQKVKKSIIQFIMKNPLLELTFDEINTLQKDIAKQHSLHKRQHKRAREKLFVAFENGQISEEVFADSLMKLGKPPSPPRGGVKASIKIEQLENLLEQRPQIRGKGLPDSFYFDLVEKVHLNSEYQLAAVYLKSMSINILEQEEIVL